jgi:tetratricopeptide (TPR) repeat protein
MALVAAGRVADARRELAEIENACDADMRVARDPELSIVRGAILLAEKRIPESITALHRASSKFMITWDLCRVCALPLLGRAYEEAGRPDSATAIYERYLSTGDADRQYVDAIWRPVVLRRLAELHAKRGDNQRATQLLQQFVALWKGADGELQPQVDAARRRLISLGARPG